MNNPIIGVDRLSVFRSQLRTNNNCESYNAQMPRKIGKRPGFWPFVRNLNKLLSINDLNIERLEGNVPIVRMRGNKIQEARLNTLWSNISRAKSIYDSSAFLVGHCKHENKFQAQIWCWHRFGIRSVWEWWSSSGRPSWYSNSTTSQRSSASPESHRSGSHFNADTWPVQHVPHFYFVRDAVLTENVTFAKRLSSTPSQFFHHHADRKSLMCQEIIQQFWYQTKYNKSTNYHVPQWHFLPALYVTIM